MTTPLDEAIRIRYAWSHHGDSTAALDLSWIGLTELPEDFFACVPDVEYINLSRNRLTSLHPNIFQHNPNLKKVDLNINLLTELPYGLFRNNPKLMKLHIESNQLATLPEDLFLYSPDIWMISLLCNHLSTLPPDLLVRSYKLQIINLSKNRIRRIPTSFVHGLCDLREVLFNDNYIMHLHLPLLLDVPYFTKIQVNRNLVGLFHTYYHNIPIQDFTKKMLCEVEKMNARREKEGLTWLTFYSDRAWERRRDAVQLWAAMWAGT